IGLKQGLEMLNIIKSYSAKTSLLDDIDFYENREKLLSSDKRSKAIGESEQYRSKRKFTIPEPEENNEEPSRAEIFTVTRTSTKGKEIDPKSQSTIDELTSRIEAGQDHEEAFVQVLGKDQLGRLRCYGASVTKSSLKRHEEIRQVRGEYDQKVSSLERQMEGVCGLLTVMLQQMNPGKSEEDIAALVQAVRNSPSDAS
ncbi:hypothetical protein PIB30_106850, partial [Stylosanthes scabra]|nr:hypothetical protein [Stylosanthes scabra]